MPNTIYALLLSIHVQTFPLIEIKLLLHYATLYNKSSELDSVMLA